jgi:hypothetical protein
MLLGARELLLPGAWCQRALARDQKGSPCAPEDARAAAWSPVGALWRMSTTPTRFACANDREAQVAACLDAFLEALKSVWTWKGNHNPWFVIPDWNDDEARTLDQVLAVFGLAFVSTSPARPAAAAGATR